MFKRQGSADRAQRLVQELWDKIEVHAEAGSKAQIADWPLRPMMPYW